MVGIASVLWAWAGLASASPSTVTEVTVYPDRASVKRVQKVELKAGINEITFDELPPTLIERSLAAAGDGPAGTRILGLDVKSRFLEADRRKRVAELEQQLRQVRDDLGAEDDVRAAIGAELAFLESLKVAAATQIGGELMFADNTPQKADAIAQLVRGRVGKALEGQRASYGRTADLSAQEGALQRELDTVMYSAEYAERDVVVSIEATAAGTGEVALSYVLPGASWSAVWDVRGGSADAKVGFELSALVTQTTGEDWKEARIELSTARPSEGLAPPEITPFWLEPQRPVYYDAPIYLSDEDDSGGDREYKKSEAPPAPPPPPPPPKEAMATVVATVNERAVATSFEVPSRAVVPGDGTRKKLRVTTVSLELRRQHVAVPRLDESAFWLATGVWTPGWPLLPGPASVYVDGAFVGQMGLPLVGTGQEVEVSFGRDDAVKVERIAEVDKHGAPDWLGQVNRELVYRYKVVSHRKDPLTLEIRDVVPVSGDERYIVKYLGDVPEKKGEEGRISFVKILQPEVAVEVKSGWRVRYPRRHPPGGLP